MSCLHIDVNLCTRAFCEYFGTVIDLHCPLKTKTIRHNNVPYMNADLRKLQYQRNMMRNLKIKIQILKISNAIAYCEINV